ncbi:MAG TPA: hypothetical protein VGM79_23490 [Streptosporangiaceae bacterium]
MRRGAKRVTRATMVLALLLTVGGYIALRHSVPVLEPASCDAGTAGTGQPVSLEVGQAGIAATIAGVAQQRALPPYAVTVALATALQESKLTNLRSGDLDSVGVFQQRPSQGWGPAAQLEDPVYATSKFFAALSKVHGYQVMPVSEAAQAVQHSADGDAYAQYSGVAGRLSAAFTGQRPRAVWCWYPGPAARPQLAAARQALDHAFGPLPMHTASDPGVRVTVAPGAPGWAVAAWLVSHAGAYGIRDISYGGYQWAASHATSGWTKVAPGGANPAPASAVVFG